MSVTDTRYKALTDNLSALESLKADIPPGLKREYAALVKAGKAIQRTPDGSKVHAWLIHAKTFAACLRQEQVTVAEFDASDRVDRAMDLLERAFDLPAIGWLAVGAAALFGGPKLLQMLEGEE